ncbi:Short-chain dehydrogenase/reductase tropE [Fusarium oxysporum f. sp. albedinis]|jgi:hypothetical protein|nr:Short-chain dehydrogenase/reductase tropE [Fusarium oxysporum f. sp. albedinis]
MGSSLVASDVQSEVGTVTKNLQQRTEPQVANGILHTPLRRGILPFINRGISGMIATTVIQPIDMVKVSIEPS